MWLPEIITSAHKKTVVNTLLWKGKLLCWLVISVCLVQAAKANPHLPERIVLLPGSSSNTYTLTWRTSREVTDSLVEITEATASPALIHTAKTLTGSRQLYAVSDQLSVAHHRVSINDLKPNLRYAYRVKGDNAWSEWLTFRTASEHFSPYRMIYLGDMQNHIQSLGARTLRAAYAQAPDARLMLHAGDLTDRHGPEDELWRQWFAAGSWILGSMVQVPVVGNHEYRETPEALPQLRAAWSAHFAVPRNGPEGLQETVYFFDYQGVRFIVLDSMAAMHSEAAASQQAQWLEKLLANNPNRWTLVSYHHPLYSAARGRWNKVVAQYWQPLFEGYSVDLVLQGDDHTYGRWQVGERAPVYTISVAGAKHNRVHPTARAVLQRAGEDAQWYQTIEFEAEHLRYRAWTVNGELYDAVDLVREPGKAARVVAWPAGFPPEQQCAKPVSHHSTDNPATNASRCWLVNELQ